MRFYIVSILQTMSDAAKELVDSIGNVKMNNGVCELLNCADSTGNFRFNHPAYTPSFYLLYNIDKRKTHNCHMTDSKFRLQS